MKKTIEELEIGTMVNDGYDTGATVAECVHGNKYYALSELSDKDWGRSVTVSDIDEPINCDQCG